MGVVLATANEITIARKKAMHASALIKPLKN
jgi:formate-dependent phosphoribosylglycinamide formyltransferase (GAR transformylase)